MSDAVEAPIETRRLLLRPLRLSDAEPLFDAFASWEVIRWLGTPPWPYTPEDARVFVDLHLSRQPSVTDYRVITLGEALIGGIEAGCRGTTDRAPVLGYWLATSHWGKGYMTEAARAYVGRIFASGSIDTIYSGAFVGNDASLRVQEKLGFRRTGEQPVLCRPRGAKLPHVNTRLERAQFLAAIQ